MDTIGAGLHPLVLHGTLVWKVALAVLVLGWGGAAYAWRQNVRALAAGSTAGLAVFAALFVGGGALGRRLGEREARDANDDGDALSPLVFATATPFHRTAALHDLVRALDVDARPSTTRRDRGAYVRILLGERRGAADFLLRYHAPEAAAEVAESVRALDLAGYGRFQAGQWQQASDDFEAAGVAPNVTVIEAHLFAKRHDRALRAVEAFADTIERSEDIQSGSLATSIRCIGLWIRAKDGDAGALAELWAGERRPKDHPRGEAGQHPGVLVHHPPICTVLLADLVDEPARVELLAPPDMNPRDHPLVQDDGMPFPRFDVYDVVNDLTQTSGAPCVVTLVLLETPKRGIGDPVFGVGCASRPFRVYPDPPIVDEVVPGGEWEEAARYVAKAKRYVPQGEWPEVWWAKREEMVARSWPVPTHRTCTAALRDVAAGAPSPEAAARYREIETVLMNGDSRRAMELAKQMLWPDPCVRAVCRSGQSPLCESLRGLNAVGGRQVCPYCGFYDAWLELMVSYHEAHVLGDAALVRARADAFGRFVEVRRDRTIAVPLNMLHAFGAYLHRWWSDDPERLRKR